MISALGRHEVSDFVLVRMGTDDGREGVGEATVTPRWSGETARGARSIIEHIFAPALIGADPLDREEIDRRLDTVAVDNWFAKSALEMACWDLDARRAAGKPVYAILGGGSAARGPSATGSPSEPTSRKSRRSGRAALLAVVDSTRSR